MKTDREGRDFIIGFESVKFKAYVDNKGYSIGVGHYILPNESYLLKKTLTREEVDQLFEKDLKEFEAELNRALIKYNFSPNQRQFNALMDLIFNCGITKVLASGLFKDIHNRNIWLKLDKNIMAIHTRREKDYAYFIS